MATTVKHDLDKIMRWLRANGIEHGAHEIVEGSLFCAGGTIEYDTYQTMDAGRVIPITHRVKQAVTYEQASA